MLSVLDKQNFGIHVIPLIQTKLGIREIGHWVGNMNIVKRLFSDCSYFNFIDCV